MNCFLLAFSLIIEYEWSRARNNVKCGYVLHVLKLRNVPAVATVSPGPEQVAVVRGLKKETPFFYLRNVIVHKYKKIRE